MKSEKEQRVEIANELIRVISQHGRQFFYNKAADRLAYLELDERGRVWLIDDYAEAPVYTHPTGFGNGWRKFSHDATLRQLVESMRDYVMTGQRIERWRIATEQMDREKDLWGYGADAAKAVRAAAYALPIMERAEKMAETQFAQQTLTDLRG
jgi:hypothetical protein